MGIVITKSGQALYRLGLMQCWEGCVILKVDANFVKRVGQVWHNCERLLTVGQPEDFC